MQTKAVSPTASYSLLVPSTAEESVDDRVASYWMPGDDTLLQLSSNKRDSGGQVSAGERLRSRIARGHLRMVAEAELGIPECPDVSAASGCDDGGTWWLFVYAVWPDLLVLASVSHPKRLPDGGSWPLQALPTLRRTYGGQES